MVHLIRLTDHKTDFYERVFIKAAELQQGKHQDALNQKTVCLFFPSTSIRTRVTFERGIYLLKGQSILFPSETLDKREALEDVLSYLAQWLEAVVVRHGSIKRMEEMAAVNVLPIINAMSSENHPCEILSDLFALSQKRKDWRNLRYVFLGENGNIGKAWREAAHVFSLNLTHCSPKAYAMEGLPHMTDPCEAIIEADIVLTDSISAVKEDFMSYQVNLSLMERANIGALLNPCPPFTRGEEVSAEVIRSDYFVGYGYKKTLLEIQQAILLECMKCS